MPSPHRAVLAAVVAVAVTGSTTACLREPSGTADSAARAATTPATASNGATTTVDPSRGGWSDFRVEAATWTGWTPVLRDVRPATEEDLEDVERRTRAVLEREFTATVEGPFGEYTLTRGRSRVHVRVGQQDRPVMDVYAERAALTDPDPQRLLPVPVTVCPASERSCFPVTGKESPGDRPHLFDTVTDSLLYLASATMTAQPLGAAFLDSVRGQGLALGTATVESPIGRLDCVVVAEGPDDLAALDGAEVEPGRSEADHGELCVDPRGLVVLAPGDRFSQVTPWTSLRTSVTSTRETYPYPVRSFPS